jgi:hypothetical protein
MRAHVQVDTLYARRDEGQADDLFIRYVRGLAWPALPASLPSWLHGCMARAVYPVAASARAGLH